MNIEVDQFGRNTNQSNTNNNKTVRQAKNNTSYGDQQLTVFILLLLFFHFLPDRKELIENGKIMRNQANAQAQNREKSPIDKTIALEIYAE